MQKIVILHTDLRIYWPARIKHFFNSLDKTKYELKVIEISGHGGNYDFDKNRVSDNYWECLFPNRKMTELSASSINEAVLKKLKEINPSIIIAGALAFPSGALAIKYSSLQNVPLILFDDAKLQDVQRNRLINWIKKQLYSGVDAIFCPSADWNDTFKYFGFKEKQLFYGVNAVDNNFFNKPQKSTNKSFDSLPRGYFLNIGRQIEKKNLLILLKAYKLIKDKNIQIPDLALVGNGDSRKELEKYVHENKLHNIHFIEFQTQNNLVELYHNASLFILPSLYAETWGLVVNEAMASGLPVALSINVGCSSTLVKENINGFTFNPNDPAELASKLINFNSLSPQDKELMAKSSKQEIELWGLDNFSDGLRNALKFVESKPKRKISFAGNIIARFWKGRYRPV